MTQFLNIITFIATGLISAYGDANETNVEADKTCQNCVSDYKVRTNQTKNMEKSLIILKPDCMEKNLSGVVMERFSKAGYRVVACKMMQLDSAILKDHYSHLTDKPFFPEIEAFMSSCPVIAMILEGDNAINGIRDLLGPTDSTTAPEGTIRGDLGETKMRNIAHASDSYESAVEEMKRFFKAEEIFEKTS